MDRKHDAVVGFSINPEVTITGGPEIGTEAGEKSPVKHQFSVSGTSLNVAMALRRCGFTPVLLGAVGQDDPINGFIERHLHRLEIPHFLLEVRDQTPFAMIEPEFDRRLSSKAPITVVEAGLVRGVLEDNCPQFQIVTGLLPDEGELEMAKALLHNGSGTKVLNPRQTLTAQRHLMAEMAQSADWLVCNRHEAAAFIGCNSTQVTLGHLSQFLDLGFKRVVITCDREGAKMASVDGTSISVGSYEHGPYCDETGAGDCFLGFFISAVLAGHDFDYALRIGNVAAGIKVTHLGAGSQPEINEVRQALAGFESIEA